MQAAATDDPEERIRIIKELADLAAEMEKMAKAKRGAE